jgi:hypothetical protein
MRQERVLKRSIVLNKVGRLYSTHMVPHKAWEALDRNLADRASALNSAAFQALMWRSHLG